MSRIVTALTLVSCLPLGGCLASTTLIKVKADGSGTLEQTMLMNVAAMRGILQTLGGGTAGSGEFSIQESFEKADPEAQSAKLGRGVTFVSSEPIAANGMEGMKAVYAFEDITALNLDESPRVPGLPGAADAPAGRVAFALSRGAGGTSVLTVKMPAPPDAASPGDTLPDAGATDPNAPQPPPEMIAMVKQMFQGMRIEMAVEVDGTVVRSSAPHVSGSKVTLIEVDFGKLLADESKLAALQQLGPGASFSEMKPLLQDIEGLKFSDGDVTIEFRGR